ncbi:MAG: hypothetical protein QN183_04730 [Armatimonadota bacterium]|nr:hypothetical protein [Armatimonadota bacterium]MDR7532434.1 hypothetical protein [Armatimonadota bacterium]MDR7535657.1 hypothetical protein [Armatimonadota bacterium]
MSSRVVLAIDPGRQKCGVAVCAPGRVLARTVVATEHLADLVREWSGRFGVTEVVIGDRTGAAVVARMVAGILTVPQRLVDEAGTTLRARFRYFAEHPPRGWRRLIPRGLQIPPRAYDDYVAVLLAEAALAQDAPPGAHGNG